MAKLALPLVKAVMDVLGPLITEDQQTSSEKAASVPHEDIIYDVRLGRTGTVASDVAFRSALISDARAKRKEAKLTTARSPVINNVICEVIDSLHFWVPSLVVDVERPEDTDSTRRLHQSAS